MSNLDDYIQMSGTVQSVLTPDRDAEGLLIQRVILINLSPSGSSDSRPIIDSKALLMVRIINAHSSIPFAPGHPITVKGKYVRQSPNELSIVHSTHAPLGFIRYDGKIYR